MKALKSYDIIQNNIDKINNSKYIENLKMLCSHRYINYDKIINLYKIYRKFQFTLQNKNIVDKLTEISKLTPLIEQNYDTIDVYQRLLFCLVQGNQYNLLKRITSSNTDNYYVNLLYPSINNVYQIKTNKFTTLIKNEYIGETILYLCKYTESNDEEIINFIANVNIKMIAKLLPLIVYHKITSVKKGMISERYYDLELKTFLGSSNILNYNVINNYPKSLMDVMNNFINNFDKNNIEKLYVIAGKNNQHIAKIKYILNNDEMEYEIKMKGGYDSGKQNNYIFINYGANYNFAKYLLKWYE